MKLISTARTTLFSALLVVGGFAIISEADNCYKNITRSCGSTHSSNKTCIDGNNSYPCNDVILVDAQVNDVGAGVEKQAPVSTDTTPITVTVHKFACSGLQPNTGVCNDNGPSQFVCFGRQATGPNCATPGGGGEE